MSERFKIAESLSKAIPDVTFLVDGMMVAVVERLIRDAAERAMAEGFMRSKGNRGALGLSWVAHDRVALPADFQLVVVPPANGEKERGK